MAAQSMGFGVGKGEIDRIGSNGFDVVRARRASEAARTAAERARLDAIKDQARAPERCGPEMIAQPAAGARVVFSPIGMIPVGKDGWAREHVGYRGRDAARAADAFDRMQAAEDRAARRGKRAPVELFTLEELGAGRRYAALVERHDAAGVRCSSVEAQRAQGSGSGGYMDALLDEGRQIARLRRAIGTGEAMGLRRIRPSVRGTRRGISDRSLVDGVCLSGRTVSEVLEAHGWAATSAAVRGAARVALKAALVRMVRA